MFSTVVSNMVAWLLMLLVGSGGVIGGIALWLYVDEHPGAKEARQLRGYAIAIMLLGLLTLGMFVVDFCQQQQLKIMKDEMALTRHRVVLVADDLPAGEIE